MFLSYAFFTWLENCVLLKLHIFYLSRSKYLWARLLLRTFVLWQLYALYNAFWPLSFPPLSYFLPLQWSSPSTTLPYSCLFILLCDLIFTRVAHVIVCLEVSIGTWWSHTGYTTGDKDRLCSSLPIANRMARRVGSHKLLQSTIYCWQVQSCVDPVKATEAALASCLKWLCHALKRLFQLLSTFLSI